MERKVNYLQLLKDSIRFTWKYKILWIFGFILALFSGSGGGGSSGNSSSDISSEKLDSFQNQVTDFVHSSSFWIIVAIAVIFLLVLTVLIWYLTSVAKISLINAVRHDNEGQGSKIKFGLLWSSSHKYLFKVLFFDLVWLFISIPILIITVVSIIGSIWGLGPGGLLVICCLLAPVLIVWGIFVGALKAIGIRLLVLRKFGIIEAIKQSWKTLKLNIGKFIVAFLVSLLPLFILGIIVFILALLTIVPAAVLFIASLAFVPAGLIMFILVFIVIVFLFVILAACIEAPFKVLGETYWTKFVMLLFGKGNH